MGRILATGALFASLSLLLPIAGASAQQGGKKDAAKPAENPACVSFTAEARYRSGYEHLVHIVNACEKAVTCSVSTDVTPAVITAHVEAKDKETVLTRRGSPASTFVANVQCKLD